MKKIAGFDCKSLFVLFFVGFALLSFMMMLPAAQLGEEAGSLNFNVQVGHNQTLQMHLGNSGNVPVGFKIQLPSITEQDNQSPPIITASPLYGVVQPYSTFPVNITVFMPLNDTPGATTWSVIISAVQSNNASNPGGAVIEEGVAKIASISAILSTTSTSTVTTTVLQRLGATAPLVPSSMLVIIVVVIVIVVLSAAALALYIKSKKTSRNRSKHARKTSGRARKTKSAHSVNRR